MTALSMASVIGVVWWPLSTQNFYYQGKIAGILRDDAGVDVLYRAILSDGEFDTSERYRLVRYDLRGVEQRRLVLARADEGSLIDVWYVRLGARLLFSASGEVQIIDLRTTTVELSYAQLIAKQPAFIEPIRRMAEDAGGIWIEDHTGLRHRIDGATLEATRVESMSELPSSPPLLPTQGCLDHVMLNIGSVKGSPRRQTVMRGGAALSKDGWINPDLLQESGQPCALQLVEGEQFILIHDSLEDAGYRVVRTGGATQWDNALAPRWSTKNEEIVFIGRHDQHLILVGESGRIGALDLELGQLAWSVDRAQLARWWGEGVGVQVRSAKLDGDMLDLWVSEEDTTLHHVRRIAATGALITSVGF